MKIFKLIGCLALSLALMNSCKKSGSVDNGGGTGPGSTTSKFSYADSVFYITSQNDVIVSPVQGKTGSYFSMPDGLSLNQKTGAIDVSKSDAGLKYRVSFAETGSKDTLSTFVLISGINYYDGFYKLTTSDSILKPVYNADKSLPIPGINNGTSFDVGLSLNNQGCEVNTTSAEINLAETVRNGVFGRTPANNDRHEFDMTYRINDKSARFDNLIKIKLYYFNSMADVTQEAYDIIASRQGTIIGPSNATSVAFTAKPAKPRPPCIFIVSH